MAVVLSHIDRNRALAVLVVLAAALAVDAAIVAVRYAVIVESDKAGDAAIAIVVAVFGVTATVMSLVSPGKPRLVRCLVAVLLVLFASVAFSVGLLSLADGEALGASLRTVAAVAILALIKPALFPSRPS